MGRPNLGPFLRTDTQPFTCAWSPSLLTYMELGFICLLSGLCLRPETPILLCTDRYLMATLTCLQLFVPSFSVSITYPSIRPPSPHSPITRCLLLSWTTTCCLLMALWLTGTAWRAGVPPTRHLELELPYPNSHSAHGNSSSSCSSSPPLLPCFSLSWEQWAYDLLHFGYFFNQIKILKV